MITLEITKLFALTGALGSRMIRPDEFKGINMSMDDLAMMRRWA
jgi:hypothetical protein